MEGYTGPDDIIKKLEFVVETPNLDLYVGDLMELLNEALEELRKYEINNSSRI